MSKKGRGLQLGTGVSVLLIVFACGKVWSEQVSDEDVTTHCITHEEPNDYIWDSNQITEIVLDDNKIEVIGSGVHVDGSVVKINSPGNYRLNGTLTDGQVVVNSDEEGLVRLILDGVNIQSSSTAPVYIKDAEKAVIILVEGTQNYLQDGRSVLSEVDEPNAVIFSKDDLSFCGMGELTVIADVNDGIVSKDGLIIAGGLINIDAMDDGIRGKDYLVIRDASIVITALGDGLKSDNDANDMGYITIESGFLDVNSGGDAIFATTDIVVSAGDITLVSGGGLYGGLADSNSTKGIKADRDILIDGGNFLINSYDDAIHADASVEVNGGTFILSSWNDGIQAGNDLCIHSADISIMTSYEGIECADANIIVSDANIYISASDDGIRAAKSILIDSGSLEIHVAGDAITADANVVIVNGHFDLTTEIINRSRVLTVTSSKGIKAGVNMIIEGGQFVIDSTDDALHSDGNIEINGGSFTFSTDDDGIRANNDLMINGGDINILTSYEGIESGDGNIIINGGIIYIVSNDDGVNVAGGGDQFGGPRQPGVNTASNTINHTLYINGGYLMITSVGDGLDINGAVEMTDGILLVNGPTMQMNGALDYDSSFKITGGYLLASGSSGMAQAPGTNSTQYSVLIGFNSTQPAGTLIHLETSEGREIFTFAPSKNYQSVAFSSPNLTLGTSYIVYYGGSSTGMEKDGLYQDGTYTPGTQYSSFTISSVVTTVGINGGGPGGPGGGRRPR